MRKLIIFGISEQAELAHYFFSTDSEFNVVGFVVDRDFISDREFLGLPVVATDEVLDSFPAREHDAFVAIGYSEVNAVRAEAYWKLKELGFNLASYISSRATILNEKIGDNCFLLEDNTIQPFVEIGNNVTLWSGNHIGHHSKIGDHCFITSHVVMSGGVTVGHHSFIGVNATLRDHISIGSRNVIGAAAVIMSSTEDGAVYVPERTAPRKAKSSSLEKI